jgi:hypothetical protein
MIGLAILAVPKVAFQAPSNVSLGIWALRLSISNSLPHLNFRQHFIELLAWHKTAG